MLSHFLPLLQPRTSWAFQSRRSARGDELEAHMDPLGKCWFHGVENDGFMGFYGIYPLVSVDIIMEHHIFVRGKLTMNDHFQ